MSRHINKQTWHRLTEEMMTGMREWRSQHPKATLREMEDERDARWVRVRARMAEVHPATARRRTEAAGAALVAHETTEATRIAHSLDARAAGAA